MKCAVIIPSWVPEDIFPAKTASSQINYWQPLGTLYVATCMCEAGHDVKVFNGAFLPHEKLINGVADYKPDFIGIYSTTFGWKQAVRTAADLKSSLGNIYITVGGPHATAIKERCLKDSESIDAVVIGEGEITVIEILDRIKKTKDLRGVKGVAFRENGKIVANPPRPLINDLDTLPFPARELLGDEEKYIPPPATYRRKPVAVIMTSRGCDRKCIFCYQMDKERKSGVRYRSVENVLDEVELCLKKGYREIKFIDDTFAEDYERAMRLAREIKVRELDFTWFASACVNQVDKPLLEAFKEAGCWAILLGAESGVQKNLNTLRKGITVEQTRLAVRAAKDAGLKVLTPFIIGIPGETYEEAMKTIEFACELDPDIANFHALTPFPGTEIYDNIEKYGVMSSVLTDYTYQGAAFIPFTLTRDEITSLRQIAFKRFYSRWRFLIKRLLSIRTANDLATAFNGLRSLFWIMASKNLFGRNGVRRFSTSTQGESPATKRNR